MISTTITLLIRNMNESVNFFNDLIVFVMLPETATGKNNIAPK